jgi:hypothetical protein
LVSKGGHRKKRSGAKYAAADSPFLFLFLTSFFFFSFVFKCLRIPRNSKKKKTKFGDYRLEKEIFKKKKLACISRKIIHQN